MVPASPSKASCTSGFNFKSQRSGEESLEAKEEPGTTSLSFAKIILDNTNTYIHNEFTILCPRELSALVIGPLPVEG
jgi:hypothetical protein